MTPRRRAFTLIEILVVLAIVVALAGITTPMLVRALDKRPEVRSRGRVQEIETAVHGYASRFGDCPPSSLSRFKVEGTNGINEGSEALVLALALETKGDPVLRWDAGALGNTDKDAMKEPLKECMLRNPALFEAVDAWGNPIVYIHNRDYGKAFTYRTAEGASVTVRARKSAKLGTWHNPGGCQLWSFGADGLDDGGAEDDIANFTPDAAE